MISKPVTARSFYHTCRYVTTKKDATILLSAGVREHDFKLMAEDFLRQQQMRPSKNTSCFHSILSFHPDEKPSDEKMQVIAKEYLNRLGIVDTQFAICKHTDKAHLHLHIIANMVNNKGKAISDSWIGLRGKKIAQQLTQEYGLIKSEKKNLRLINEKNLNGDEAVRYEIYKAVQECLPLSRNWKALETLLHGHGITLLYKYKSGTTEIQGISFKKGNHSFKGSAVDRAFSFGNIEKFWANQYLQTAGLNPKVKMGIPGRLPKEHTWTLSKAESSSHVLVSLSTSGLEKFLEILLRPEYTSGQTPYEFTEEAFRRRKKKKNRDHGLRR